MSERKVLFFLMASLTETVQREQGDVCSLFLEMFLNVLGHFGTFWDIFGHFRTFWDILGHFGTFWDILGHFKIF